MGGLRSETDLEETDCFSVEWIQLAGWLAGWLEQDLWQPGMNTAMNLKGFKKSENLLTG